MSASGVVAAELFAVAFVSKCDTLFMYSPFITNCVMHGDVPLDACIQGYHLIVGTTADPVTWANSQRLLQVQVPFICTHALMILISHHQLHPQAGSSDESSDNFLLPMLDSVVVQVRLSRGYCLICYFTFVFRGTGAQWQRRCCGEVQIDSCVRFQ